MTSYFYVSKIGGGKPSFKHLSFDEAVREAERLIDTVGGEYEILEARAVVKPAPKYIVQDFQQSAEFSAVLGYPPAPHYRNTEEDCPF
jgi:hypothetical protein